MRIDGITAVVTGGASGLGLASAERLHAAGASVAIIDLPTSAGAEVAERLGAGAIFAPADVTSEEQMEAALDRIDGLGPPRALVHCAGRGKPLRTVDREGNPGSLADFTEIVTLNLVGSFNALRLCAARMTRNEPLDGDRGVCILTASAAAFEGQIGQIPYASSKAGVHGMTLVAARDLAGRLIRVCTIAPGTFDTPLLASRPQEIRDSLAAATPHPKRLGDPVDFARLAAQIIENPMLNGETIRLDGAIRMAPR
ncbi:MAG TPA: SDR family NAD(P)-dependent oxidoreductase [Solirubrobacterales bacterium]|nr:SDR family NAD(P)-dependent oxidoreductase [Solirubrobacterales bacterium]